MTRSFHIPALVLLTAAALATGTAVVAAPKEAPAAAALFKDDKRLAAPVRAAEQEQPLGEWLGRLGSKLGVPLVPDRTTADIKITVFEDQLPAAELLTRVARHLELEWIRGTKGYVLVEPAVARGRAERYRQEEWLGVQRWMEQLSKVADLPEDAVQARSREAERRLKEPTITPEQRREQEEEQALMADLRRHSRAVPVAVRIYRALNPVQLDALRTNGFLRLSSAYGTLSPQVVAATHDALRSPGAEDPNEVRHAELTLTLQETSLDRDRKHGGRQSSLYVELIAVRPDRSTSMLNWRPRSPGSGVLPVGQPAPKDDPELSRPLDQKLEPRTTHPAVRESGATGYLYNQWPPAVTLGEICEVMHRITGLSITADGFTRARLTPDKLTGVKTMADLLDTVTRELDYTWTRDGKRLTLQSRTRAYDRAAEVPQRVLEAFRKRAANRPDPTLDDYAAVAAALTDSQCRGLTDLWGYYLEGTGLSPIWASGGMYESRHQLRFWASLNPAQRRAALEMLTTDALTPAQGRALALAMSAPGDDLNRPDCIRIPTPEALPGLRGGFQLKQRQVEVQAYQDDKGNYTATIATVGAGRIGGFNRFGPPSTPIGPKTQMPAVDFVFYLLQDQAQPKLVRSNNYHLVPRYGP